MSKTIRTRSDGSIDTAYYMQRGRQARSDAAADLARNAKPRRRLVVALATFSGVAWLLDIFLLV